MADSVVNDLESRQRGASPTLAPRSILSRLRLETRAEHDAVEQLLGLMGVSLTQEGYLRRLQQFYGFYAPLEMALQLRDVTLPPAMRAGLAGRLNKTNLLRQDLHCLGAQTDALPLCRDLPPLRTQAEVLGCVYVVEGASLGGRLISQHILAALGITPSTGGSFFEGYGDATGSMWQAMRQLLVSGSPDTGTENTIVANAIATFASLRNWCEAIQKLTVQRDLSPCVKT